MGCRLTLQKASTSEQLTFVINPFTFLLVASIGGPSVKKRGELCPDESAWRFFADRPYKGVQVVGRRVRAELGPVIDARAQEAGRGTLGDRGRCM